ncbi:MAG: hypothetical protein HZR80_10960 [Candidatus Heimdallarchaeota archaeon]
MFKPWVPVSDAGLGNKHAIPKSKINESDSVFWGLGWGLEKTKDGSNFWHWGNNGSFQNLVFANIEEKSGFILMNNYERTPFVWEEILKIAFGTEHPGFDWLMSFYYD